MDIVKKKRDKDIKDIENLTYTKLDKRTADIVKVLKKKD